MTDAAQSNTHAHRPEIAGFSYVEDDAAYRIRCDTCGVTAGTLGRSEDYAHGWLDHWASDHLDDCVGINLTDLRVDVFRNNVTSAVRITHLPTGLQGQSSPQKSGIKAKEEAMADLRQKLRKSRSDRVR